MHVPGQTGMKGQSLTSRKLLMLRPGCLQPQDIPGTAVVFRCLKGLTLKSQDSTGLKLFAKVQKGVYVIVTVLEIDSFYLHWCWNNVFLQGETNV